MAVTENSYIGNGSTTNYSFTFPYLKSTDVQVQVDAAVTTAWSFANATTVQFNTAPDNGAKIKILRDTNVDSLAATFYAGSSIKSEDLNDNYTQNLYKTQEVGNRYFSNTGGTMTGDLTLGEDVELIFEGATDDAHETKLTVVDPTADQTYRLPNLSAGTYDLVSTGDTGTVARAMIANDAIDGTKIADDSINSEHYVDGSIDLAHLSANSVNSSKIVDGSIVADDLATDAVTTVKITNLNVTRDKIAADAINGTKLADDSVDSEHIVADSLDTEHYAPTSIDSAALASNAVTESKITDANVTTNKIANSNVTLGKLHSDLKQTTISNSDTQLPTSGAVVDYVAAQIAPIGGLEVIADEDNFPTSQPASGVVISISDAAGIVVQDGTGGTTAGRSTTARTAGNGSDNVTINNFPSSLYGETLATGVGLMVSSTGSSNTYNYHKILAAETDVKQLSDDINDFNARYRVSAGEPGSNNDEGDLVYDTNANKMKVYDTSTSAWKEVTSTGDFKYLYLCPAGGSGAPTLNGSIATYDLRESSNSGSAASVTSAAQLLVSINGVVQKANTGTSAPAEGFALVDANTIIFGANLASGDSVFIVQFGSALTITTPGDGTVSATKIASGAVETAKIADGAVTEIKLGISNSGSDGQYLQKQSGNTGGLTWATVATPDSDKITEGNTSVEVVDAQGNNDIGVIKADLGYTDGSGNSSTESNYFHSTKTGNDYLTEINQAHNGNNNTLKLSVGNTGGIGAFHIEKGSSGGVNTGVFSYSAASGGGQWTLSTGGQTNYQTTQTANIFNKNVVPNTDSSIDLGLTGTRFANAYVDTYYGDGSNLTGIASTVAGGAIYENSQTISTTHTIPTGSNGMSAGPVTVNNGVTLTISNGSTYTIV